MPPTMPIFFIKGLYGRPRARTRGVASDLDRRPGDSVRVSHRPLREQQDPCIPYAFGGNVEGRPNVPATNSTKFLSSRRITRLLCAKAKLPRAAESACNRPRYVS